MIITRNTTILFCEGILDGLDKRFFEYIRPVGDHVYVQPLGGKHGMNAYIDGYLSRYSDSQRPKYIAIRDRDFDRRPDNSTHNTLIRASERTNAKPIWLTYRACLENYLITPKLIHQYLHERSVARNHSSDLPAQPDIQQEIDDSARALADYQAVRWGLASLKQNERWPEINTNWTGGSGKLPESMDFDTCLSQAIILIKNFHNDVEDVDESRFADTIEEFRGIFNEPAFFDEEQYVYWFHGKDLSATIFRRLRELLEARNLPHNISRKRFEEWACEHIDDVSYPDIQQLINLLEST